MQYKHFGAMSTVKAMKKINMKATHYSKTETARSIKAETFEVEYANPEHYGINNGTDLGISNLLALILYTDFDGLSSDFSSSFRKIDASESFESVKTRNSYYWWWSKILRETVELYGIGQYGRNHGLNGPLFTGLPSVMNIPQYQIKFNSPRSASTYMEVAAMYSGDEGMVMELDVGDDHTMKYLKGFNCSWISQYKEEHEMYVYIFICLFICINI